MRAIDQNRLGLWANNAAQFINRKCKFRCTQSDGANDSASHRHTCRIRVIERLHQNHFVTRINEPKHDGSNGLSATAGDGDLSIRCNFNTARSPKASRHCRVQFRHPKGPRVLTKSILDSTHASILDELRTIKVWEALPQIHCAMLRGES